jgi:hypothetical protein
MATTNENIVLGVDIKLKGGESVKSLKGELRDLKNQLGQLDPASKAFDEAAKRAGHLQEKIRGVNDSIQNADPEKKFAPFARTIAGLAGGFAAVQGAMALFGSESADLQKALVKVQGAMALSNGLNSLLEFKNDFKELGGIIKTNVTKAFSTLRGAIAATGIGLLVVAVGLLVANWEKVVAVLDSVFPGFKKLTTSVADNTEALEKNIEKNKESQNFYKKIIDARLAGIKDVRDKETAELKERQRRETQEAQREYSTRSDFNSLMSALEQQHLTELGNLSKKFQDEDDAKKKEKNEKDKQEAERLNQQAKKLEEDRIAQVKLNAAAETAISAAKVEKIKQDFEDIKTQTDASVSEVETLRNNALKAVDDTTRTYETRQEILDAYLNAGLITQKEYADAEVKIEQEKMNAKMQILQAFSQVLINSSELAGKETAAGKALAVASTTIDTYVAAFRAYKEGFKVDPTGTFSIISAAAATLAGVAAVKNILKVKVPGGGGGGTLPTPVGGGAPNVPQQVNGTRLSQESALLTRDVNQGNTKVYVLESDISDSQRRIDGIKQKATIG